MAMRDTRRNLLAFLVAMALSLSAAGGAESTGFEVGTAGWTCPPNASIDTGVARSGRQSVRIAVKDRNKDVLWMTRRIPVQSGASYDVSCFVKTENQIGRAHV